MFRQNGIASWSLFRLFAKTRRVSGIVRGAMPSLWRVQEGRVLMDLLWNLFKLFAIVLLLTIIGWWIIHGVVTGSSSIRRGFIRRGIIRRCIICRCLLFILSDGITGSEDQDPGLRFLVPFRHFSTWDSVSHTRPLLVDVLIHRHSPFLCLHLLRGKVNQVERVGLLLIQDADLDVGLVVGVRYDAGLTCASLRSRVVRTDPPQGPPFAVSARSMASPIQGIQELNRQAIHLHSTVP